MVTPHRIDVHHHPSPPSYLAARTDNRNVAAQLGWSVAKSIEDMERGGVAVSMLSLPYSRHIFSGPAEEDRRLVREWNDFMAGIARDHPGRFGVFASLPILDIEATLREIDYALGTLRADGFTLMTNIGDKWMGDPYYAPVFEELNRRKAVVYTHPVAPDCCRGMTPGLNDSVIEYATDTTRAIARMLFSGSAARYPDIRVIWSHGGGTMPYIVERFTRAHMFSKDNLKEMVPDGVIPALNRFYYDTAQASHIYAMSALTKVVGVSQLMFGTDFPYRTAAEHVQGLASCGFSAAELHAIDCGNAHRLMPQFATR